MGDSGAAKPVRSVSRARMTTEGWCSAVNAWMGYCRAKKGIYTTYTQPLVGLALDVHAARLDAKVGGDIDDHRRDVRRDLGCLRDHRRVDVADTPSRASNRLQRATQQHAAIGAAKPLVGIGEHAADVAEPRRAEQRIRDRVQQRVGVGMAEQAARMRDVDTAENQLAPGHQRMDVVTLADAEFRAHLSSSFRFASIHSASRRSSG